MMIAKQSGHGFMNRRGQITIFIIVAIIILFTFALYFYVQSSGMRVRPPVQTVEVSTELEPVQMYVTQCLSRISKDGLIKLGANGGYIYPEKISGIEISPRAYTSDALVYTPNTLPYWYYLKDDEVTESNPYGTLRSHRPPLCSALSKWRCVIEGSHGANSIEEQLNEYVARELAGCINNFGLFSEQFVITPGTMRVETIIGERDVGFKLDYPLDITVKSSGKRERIPYFYAQHTVALKEVYLFATDITIAEMNTTFLERITTNLISVYSGIDSNLLPPMSGIDFFVAEKQYWVRSEVQSTLQDTVLPYTEFIQIVNAPNSRKIYPQGTQAEYLPFEEGLYKSLMVKTSDTFYGNLTANVFYPYEEMYLVIGDSEIIRPRALDPGDNPLLKIAGFFMNDYRFKYDISYPVVFRIRDPYAFNGEGYTFNIALETNIRQNVPVTGNLSVVSFGNVTRMIDFESQLQTPQRIITIDAIDKYTGKPLEGVLITYQCGARYTIGKTTISGKLAQLSARMPYCAQGGIIIYEKPGYVGSSISYNNIDGGGSEKFKIALWPTVKKEVVIKKRTPSQVDALRSRGAGALEYYHLAAGPLAPVDSVFLTVNRIKETPYDTDVPLIGFLVYTEKNQTITIMQDTASQRAQIESYFADGSINSTTRDELLLQLDLLKTQASQTVLEHSEAYTLELAPGTFDFDAFMVYNKQITIPKEVRTFCAVPLGPVCLDEKSITLEETNFSAWISGGAKYNYTFTPNEIYNNDTLVLYVLEMPIPQNWGMVEAAKTIDTYQLGKTHLLRPRFEE